MIRLLLLFPSLIFAQSRSGRGEDWWLYEDDYDYQGDGDLPYIFYEIFIIGLVVIGLFIAALIIRLIFESVKKEYEDLFNEVYDEEHIPHLLNVPGVNKVTRGKGIPFNFSIGGETKSMDSPNQKFVAMYEIDNPEVINSKEWAIAVEKGRWSTQVRQHTYDRSHFLYECC